MFEFVLCLVFVSVVLIYIELRWAVVPILKEMGLYVKYVERPKVDLVRITVPRVLNVVEKASVSALGLESSFEVKGLLETRRDYKEASDFYYGEIEISCFENFNQRMMARKGSVCSVKCFKSGNYARTEEFILLYDDPAFDGHHETLPLQEFEPILRRVMARPINSIYKAPPETITTGQ